MFRYPTTLREGTYPLQQSPICFYNPFSHYQNSTPPPLIKALLILTNSLAQRHPTTHTHTTLRVFHQSSTWRSANIMPPLNFTNIAQRNIPISTAAHTHHVSITLPLLFQKTFFPKFFGPFPKNPGAPAPHFRIPLRPLHFLKFFPRFDLFHFLLHGHWTS